MNNELNESEVVFEVRGKDNSWKVFYPEEGGIKTALPVYDKEGKLKSVVYAGEDTGKLTESFEEFSRQEDAIEYAKLLGADKINIITNTGKGRRKKKKEPEYLKDF